MSASSTKLPATLARTLDRVRQGHLLMKLAEFPILLVAGIAAAGCFQALADLVFDLPWGVRLIFLLLDLIAIGWLAWRYAAIPWLKRLDRQGAALLVERGVPELRSSLISTVELSLAGSEVPAGSRLLVQRLVAETTAKVKDLDVAARVVRPDRVRKLALWMLAPVVPAVLLLVIGWPVSGLLVKRVLLSSSPLPADTAVVSVTEDLTIEEGDEVMLGAQAAGVVPSEGRLIVMRAGKPDETFVMPIAKPGSKDFITTLKNVREPFRYRFELNDGIGRTHEVVVRKPPVAKDVRFFQIYPDYTRLPEEELRSSGLKLLDGSTVRIEGSVTKALDSGTVTIKQGETSRTVEFGPRRENNSFTAKLTDAETAWKALSIHLKGREGDESVKDPVYPVQVVPDRLPQVVLASPKEETITALADETIAVAAEVSDDFGLAGLDLHYRVLRPDLNGGFDDSGNGRIPFSLKGGERSFALRLDWNLGRLNPAVSAGTRVVFWIEARDTNSARGRRADRNLPPVQDPATYRTPERTITIVSEGEKRMELLEEFGRKAKEIEQLYDNQREINDRLNLPRR
ncbi:MAG: hypothetical protein V4689_10005 [Verrucomicrobiota bacterium]